jgi:hypothetical protein
MLKDENKLKEQISRARVLVQYIHDAIQAGRKFGGIISFLIVVFFGAGRIARAKMIR